MEGREGGTHALFPLRKAKTLPKRKIYDLKWTGDDWALQQRGATRATRRFKSKAEGLKKSPKLVRGREPSQLVIRKQNGRIQEERTYPRSSDPKHRPG
jgi:hypothetical protein